MEIIRTTRQLGQAVKNAKRLRQILSVFSRKGFTDIVNRLHLEPFLPSKLSLLMREESVKSPAERLREAFEILGPTFVKLGQILSTRQDLLPEAYIEEFSRLQDNVQPISFETVRVIVEKELGQSLAEAYRDFQPIPLASASIGQVHEATLHSGEKVVVKIQRPGIQKTIQNDISLLAFLAKLLERYIPEARVINPVVFVDEFLRTISNELDYKIEANTMKKIAANIASIPDVIVPQVFEKFSTHKILTLQKIDGIRVTDVKALDQAGIDRAQIVSLGTRVFFKTVMVDGIFHGDLHAGNLFVLPGNKIAMIDFGIVGRLSERSRDQFASMVMALLNEDYETLCYEYAELGAAASSIDFEGFEREIRSSISPYLGLSLKEVNVGRVLMESTKIATKYQIKIPGDWMIVFKALLTMEGMGRTLQPDFDLISQGKDLMGDLVKRQFSPHRLTRDWMFIGRDVASLLRVMPKYLRWMFKKLNANDFAIEIRSPDLQDLNQQLSRNGKRAMAAILGAGMLIASALTASLNVTHTVIGMPVLSFFYFVAGFIFVFLAWMA